MKKPQGEYRSANSHRGSNRSSVAQFVLEVTRMISSNEVSAVKPSARARVAARSCAQPDTMRLSDSHGNCPLNPCTSVRGSSSEVVYHRQI